MGINVPQMIQKKSGMSVLGDTLGVVKTGMELYQGAKEASRKSEEYGRLEAIRKRAEDPASDESRAAREEYSKITGSPIAESVSRETLEKKFGPLANYTQKQYENKLGIEKDSAKERENRRTELAKLGQKGALPPKGGEFIINPLTGEKELVAKLTDAQLLSGGFAKRLEQAEGNLRGRAEGGYDPTTAGESIQRSGLFPEILRGENSKLQQQDERNFVSAVLRKESGAAITPSEYQTEGDKYFPRAGDTPAVVAQKEASRAQAIENMKASAGGAYSRVPSVETAAIRGPYNRGGEKLINEAHAGDMPSFTAEDLAALSAAKERIARNPSDKVARRALDQLNAKGLK